MEVYSWHGIGEELGWGTSHGSDCGREEVPLAICHRGKDQDGCLAVLEGDC
jgi:hypothetical protein